MRSNIVNNFFSYQETIHRALVLQNAGGNTLVFHAKILSSHLYALSLLPFSYNESSISFIGKVTYMDMGHCLCVYLPIPGFSCILFQEYDVMHILSRCKQLNPLGNYLIAITLSRASLRLLIGAYKRCPIMNKPFVVLVPTWHQYVLSHTNGVYCMSTIICCFNSQSADMCEFILHWHHVFIWSLSEWLDELVSILLQPSCFFTSRFKGWNAQL